MNGARERVTLIKPVCERFRVPFYERLGDLLGERGVELDVAYGRPRDPAPEYADGPFRYGREIRSGVMRIGGSELTWQRPGLRRLAGARLVIVQQGNANLFNHALLAARPLLGYRLAFWGHGANFQRAAGAARERLKRIYSRWADHWFAYSELSARVLRDGGVESERITVVNNTIDVEADSALYDRLTEADAARTRRALGIPEGARVGLFCGRLYRAKRLDFLMEAATEIRRVRPEFQLLIVGEGAAAALVDAYAREHPDWVHRAGARFGREKAELYRIADVQLLPGAAGLPIVDSFAFATPLVTTGIRGHGPEIAYLSNGANGVIAGNSIAEYARAVLDILDSAEYRERLVEGCRAARRNYTLEAMAGRFADGVQAALERRG